MLARGATVLWVIDGEVLELLGIGCRRVPRRINLRTVLLPVLLFPANVLGLHIERNTRTFAHFILGSSRAPTTRKDQLNIIPVVDDCLIGAGIEMRQTGNGTLGRQGCRSCHRGRRSWRWG